MFEIKLRHPDDFLKIAETLTRIGIASNKEKILYQSCHILQKGGRYYIVHFKELLMLDGREVDFTMEDRMRRNNIARLLCEWELCDDAEPSKERPYSATNNFRILSFKQKEDWTLRYKYRIGA